MIYIEVKTQQVVMSHHKPFDVEYGLGKTKEELLETGYLVEEIPTFEEREGYRQTLFYDGNEFYVEYTEVVVPVDQTTAQIQALEKKMDDAIMELTLAMSMGGMPNV